MHSPREASASRIRRAGHAASFVLSGAVLARCQGQDVINAEALTELAVSQLFRSAWKSIRFDVGLRSGISPAAPRRSSAAVRDSDRTKDVSRVLDGGMSRTCLRG